MNIAASHDRLRWPETVGLVLLAGLFIWFGYHVVVRAVFQDERKTDFGVYARAGYAVRTGIDLYDKNLCDDRGWHYCYPPTFAILVSPLADPFGWESREGYLPFWESIAIWYAISVALLVYAIHTFASVAVPDARVGGRRWWYARTVPLYVCLCGVGFSLSRGQVNLLLLALVAGLFAAVVRKRPMLAGAWLAGAVALKVIPGFLALFPLVIAFRPGGGGVRAVFGNAVGGTAGLVILLIAIPSAVWGLTGAIDNNLVFVDAVLAPGALGIGNQDRAVELTNATATDSQSFQSVLHTWQHPNKATRPNEVAPATRIAHWAIGGVMTLLTVGIGLTRLGPTPADRLLLLGCFTVVMLLLTPVSHMHYYAMVLPLVAGLWAKDLVGAPLAVFAAPRTVGLLVVWSILTFIPLLPGPEMTLARDAGMATLATVGLWAYGLVRLGSLDPHPHSA